tara:strand:+ start:307 stop:1683 length:1377 start_codon:yes stop_codon:yes gene_type:complete
MTSKNPPESAGNIVKFRISSNFTDYAVELQPGVVDFRYYENVLSNSVTASATIVETGYQVNKKKNDTQSTVDGLPIRGGERTDITIEDAYGNELTFEEGLYVNRLRDVDPGTSKDLYFLDFTSREFFANEQTRVVKKYEGNIGDNVEKILKDVLKVTSDIEIDNTAVPFNFIGNDRKPFYICTWLASKSIPQIQGGEGGASGYLFFQTRDGYHFRSIDKIFQEEPKKKYIFNNSTQVPKGYDARMLTCDIDSDVDLGKNLMMGMYTNRSIFFDPLSFNYEVRSFPEVETPPPEGQIVGKIIKKVDQMKEYLEKLVIAENEPVVDVIKEEFRQSPTRLMSFIMDTGVMPSGITSQEQLNRWNSEKEKENFDVANTMVQSIMRYNQLFTVKTEITIPGDFSIKAGDVIECDFPKLSGDEQKETNSETHGTYMVASVCHRITPTSSTSSLSLVRDSFGGNL